MTTETRQTPGSPEFLMEMQAKAVDAFSAFAQANQGVLQDFVEFSARAATEGARVYAELQSALVEAAREGQPSPTPSSETVEAFQRNPFTWYHKSLLGAAEGTRTAFKLVEANAQVATRSAERLQTSAEQTGKHIQETLTAYMTRMKEIYGIN